MTEYVFLWFYIWKRPKFYLVQPSDAVFGFQVRSLSNDLQHAFQVHLQTEEHKGCLLS